MFNLHDFVMDTIVSMIGKEPEYKVRQYALAWLEKDVLTQGDLAGVEDAYAAFEAAKVDKETEKEITGEACAE